MIDGIPDAVMELAARCASVGGRAYLVGGGVRDHLMGRKFHDWDIEVFGVDIDRLGEILRKFGTVSAVGKSFGVYKLRPRGWAVELPEVDVSVPRRDSKVGPGHKGIAVEGDPNMSLRDATRRRDLTINAILYDIVGEEIIDLWGGRDDLAAGVLRAVDRTTFLEDPLRALRVIQFAARLDFRVDVELVQICRAADLHELPAERIQAEWGKLLMSSRPSVGFRVAREAAILSRVFPEVAALDNDLALDRLANWQRDTFDQAGRRWAVMLATWLHGASTEAVTATMDRIWLHRWRNYPLRDRLLDVVRHFDHPADTDTALRNLSARAEVGVVLRARWAITEDDRLLDFLERATDLGIQIKKPEPLIFGRDLKNIGVQPGPMMGQILKAVYQRQLDGDVSDRDGALAAAKQLIS